MTDDIVTRLRYRAKVCNHGLSPNAPEGTEVYITIPCDRCEPLTQAADEIERLQKIIRDYCFEQEKYEDYMNQDFREEYIIPQSWKDAYTAFEKEARKIEFGDD